MAISLGSGLLAATLLLGQPQELPSQPQAGARPSIFGGFGQPAQAQPSRPLFPWFSREDRPVMNKLQSWFGRGNKDSQEPPLQRQQFQSPIDRGPTIIEGNPSISPAIISPTTPTPIDFPRKLPNSQSKSTLPTLLPQVAATPTSNAKPLQQTTLALPTLGEKSPIHPKLANKMGRDEKFEWITGQLEIESGGYVLYYATPETVDIYKGRIALHPQQVDMSAFRRGDLVSVRGDVAQRQTAQGRTPIYRATDIQMIERVK